MGQLHKLTAQDGTIVPLFRFKAKAPAKAVFLMLPALGVKAKFYKHVAAGLAAAGITTLLFEQRGHGESPYRPHRSAEVGYTEYLTVDLPAALDWAQEQYPGAPLFLGGHSLGAHLSNFMAAYRPNDITGLIHIACVFPFHGFYSKNSARMLRLLCILLPTLTRIFGYYQGSWFGFGAKEYRQVMLDWRDWALTGCYDYGQIRGIETRMAAYEGPLLSLSFDGDRFASEKALMKPRQVMAGARVTRKHLTKKEQGQHLGHFDWARRPTGTVKTITDWIDTCLI